MWKMVREVVFRFSYWRRQQEIRKTRSFFVFLTAVRSKKNELTVYTRTTEGVDNLLYALYKGELVVFANVI